MSSNTLLLIKVFLRSTGDINVLKYSNDKAKRRFAKNNLIGQSILYVLGMLYCTMMSVGLAMNGLAKETPALCALLLLILPFLFTLFKANGYLFGFKEYDMIMSMPFSIKSIVAGKFWYMYLKSMPLYTVVTLSMLIGYASGGGLTFLSCVMWLVMAIMLPIIPMVLASALGAIIVKIGAGFRHKSIAQAGLIIIAIMPLFFSRYFIEDTIRNDEISDVLQSLSDSINSATAYVPFAKWFSDAVNEGSFISLLLVIVTAVAAYELFFELVSKFYRRMNSQLSAGTAGRKFELTAQKQQSMVKAVAFKEFKRMMGSTTYLVNAGLGQIMVTIIGIAVLFVKPDTLIETVLQGAPIEPALVFPAVPLLFYFFLGMLPTTACSPSLEGKNYWIMQTLPISPMDDNKGKILYNLCITIPFAVFATITTSICFRVSFADALTSVIAMCSLCIFSTVSGLRSGLKHRRLDWENEIEVIKQGMGVSMYIIPHIIMGIVLMPLSVVANYYLHSIPMIMLLITLIAWGATLLCWKGVKKYT